jgi:hypothetical protein
MVVFRLRAVTMVDRSRVAAPVMALWWSRAGQERRRCLQTAHLQLPPVPPSAPSSHRTSTPHPRGPHHNLSLRLWNLQNGQPFRRAPAVASSVCSLHHQPLGEEISHEEQVIDLGLSCSSGRVATTHFGGRG